MNAFSSQILEEIHDATTMNGASLTDQELLEIAGETADLDELRKEYDQFVKAQEKPASQREPAKAKSAAKPQQRVDPKTPVTSKDAPKRRVVLRHADGTTSELEFIKETGSAIFVKVPDPKAKDEVTIRLKGVDVIVDINELLELSPTEVRHGMPVSTLLTIAAAAK